MMAAVAELESSLELSLGGGAGPGGLPPARSRIFKIIVIGDSNVGKTCLTYRFCAGRFPQRTEATIGVDFRERAVTIDGERIKVGGATRPRAPAGGRGGEGSETPETPCPAPTPGVFGFARFPLRGAAYL